MCVARVTAHAERVGQSSDAGDWQGETETTAIEVKVLLIVWDGVPVTVDMAVALTVWDGVPVTDDMAVAVTVWDGVPVTDDMAVAVTVWDGVPVTVDMAVAVTVWDALDVIDGALVGKAVPLGDGLGVGVAKALVLPGRHTISTTRGHSPTLQLQAPYSVLSTHEPGPVHEIVQRSGMDGRVQNMTVPVQESTPEQLT